MGGVQSRKKLVRVAVDFGTTNTGYAFKFTGDRMLYTSLRQPTCVLLNHDLSFHSFGTEAKSAHKELDNGNNKIFIEHFKMVLYHTERFSMSSNTMPTIVDEHGRSVDAMTVIGHILRHLKNIICEHIMRIPAHVPGDDFFEHNVDWVFTVPTIWSESARKFMVMAAAKAGLVVENVLQMFRLVLEPEATALYVIDTAIVLGKQHNTATLPVGQKYVLADLGGGTVDICVHEILKIEKLCELDGASGSNAGGLVVNKAFEHLLVDIFDNDVVEEYRQRFQFYYSTLIDQFEMRKREFSTVNMSTVTLPLGQDILTISSQCDVEVRYYFEVR